MKKIKEVVRRSYFLSWLLYVMFRYQYKDWRKKCEERKKMDLFDYEPLAQDLPLGISHPNIDNNLYGLHEILCEYGSLSTVNHRIFFEHGLIFGSLVQVHAKKSFANRILTFSKYRENYILPYNKDVIRIGPYIHYSESILDEIEFKELKKALGRILLVFPSHSIKALKKEFDFEAFLTKIQECSSGFDTVVVCLYWKDIQLGRGKIYEDIGFKVVTAGHFHDKYFLPRLRTIIELSDSTMSNDIGTHIGYCIYLRKPHYIFGQDVKLEALNAKKTLAELSQRCERDFDTYYDIRAYLLNAFSTFDNEINERQHDVVSRIWGINDIKSKTQIFNILQ